MAGGFYKRRRGILEHLENGHISLVDLAVHDFLSLKANLVIDPACSIPPGVCFSSSVAIHNSCSKRGLSERTIRRSLQHLEQIGWIKRWPWPGKRGNYPILVCRASVHDLSGVEYRVSGAETTDWRHPALVPAAVAPGIVHELSTYREKRIERREKTNPAAKPAPSADPRFQPFVDLAYATFESKHQRKPSWGRKHFKSLKNLLGCNRQASAQDLERAWTNYLASTEPFTARQGDSLAYFCSNFDIFADGPILAAPRKGVINADQRTRENFAAAGMLAN